MNYDDALKQATRDFVASARAYQKRPGLGARIIAWVKRVRTRGRLEQIEDLETQLSSMVSARDLTIRALRDALANLNTRHD
jgi:hypothetical protein